MRTNFSLIVSAAVALALPACGPHSGPNVGGASAEPAAATPGGDPTAKTTILEAGAATLQAKAPLSGIHAHVCGFHYYAGDVGRQVEAHHYCSHLNQDVMQCIIYDSDKQDARLIGIEYIVSAKVFASLPDEEKRLWHSHVYEVSSGELTGPGLPDVAEKQLMKDLIGTYGKTWHTWQIDRGDQLPVGFPQLMMGFTKDGQADPLMVQRRDQRYGTSSAAKRQERADIPHPEIDPEADGKSGTQVMQLSLSPAVAKDVK